jgi:hypothetical protein
MTAPERNRRWFFSLTLGFLAGAGGKMAGGLSAKDADLVHEVGNG